MGAPLVGRQADLRRAERHLEPRGGAVLLVGGAGVGKTRLARELLDRARARGAGTRELRPNTASAQVPFAAFADLLPAERPPAGDPTAVLQSCLGEVRRLLAAGPVALLVDDAHLLDPGGLALLPLLTGLDGLRLVLTIRSDDPVPTPLTAMWKDGLAHRQDLAALERADTVRLAEAQIGGPVAPGTAALVWELSHGNPLALTELLHAAQEQGQLERRHGQWHLTGRPVPSGRLVDIVTARLVGLGEAAETALAALAVAEPVGREVLVGLVGAEAVDALEAAGLVDVRTDGRRRQLHLGHPLIGEVLRERLRAAQQRAVAGRLLEVQDALGSRRPGDLLRWAVLAEHSGHPAPPDRLLAAAREALGLGDPARAEELAERAADHDGGADALLVVGEARSFQRHADAAEEALLLARQLATSAAQHAQVGLARFHNALFNRGDPGAAQAALADAAARVTDAGWQAELSAARAMLALLVGDLDQALASAAPVLDDPDTAPPTLLRVLTVSTAARTVGGDLAAARHDIERARPLLPALDTALPLARDQIGITEVLVGWHDGQVGAAVDLARERLAGLDRRQAAQWGAWATALAIVLTEAGQADEALDLAEEAATALGRGDPLGLRGTALAVAIRCAAVLGHLDRAAHLSEEARTAPPDLRTTTHLTRAEVWLRAARGELGDAVSLAVAEGRARSATLTVWGAALLHDAVRFGQPAEVVASLEVLAAAHDAGLLVLYRDHARALRDRDVGGLVEVAGGFARGGFALYAAEARAQARDLRGYRHATSEAAQATPGSGPVTPALLRSSEPLTPRERQIAMMARLGLSSREIADRLVLSVRTVDNHLSSVYRKVGVRSRRELATALTDADLDPGPEAEPVG